MTFLLKFKKCCCFKRKRVCSSSNWICFLLFNLSFKKNYI